MLSNQELETLMNKYGDEIFRMCLLYLKDYQLAEDAVQETFMKALTAYEGFEHRSSEKTWLTRIAINCCKNIMRTHWFRMLQNSISDYREKSSENVIDAFVEKNSLSGAIMRLSLQDRQILLFYYYQELSLREISSSIGISENAANQRLHRAKKRLRKILMEIGYEYEF